MNIKAKPIQCISVLLAAMMVLQPCAAEASSLLGAGKSPFVPAIPRSLGTVSETFHSKSSDAPHIWLIQDAHTNVSGQQSVSGIVEYLNEQMGLNSIYFEGGSGDVSLSYLRQLAAPSKRKKVADDYLRKGRLNGVEYLDITSDLELNLWGVEDLSLYEESLGIYGEIVAERSRILQHLAKMRTATEKLKKNLYSPELYSYDRLHQSYADEEIQASEYHRALVGYIQATGQDVDQYRQINGLHQTLQIESHINFKSVSEQMNELFAMAPTNVRDEIQAASPTDSDKKLSGEIEHRHNLTRLKEAVQKQMIQAENFEDKFPDFDQYLRYLERSESTDIKGLIEEQALVESVIYERLLTTQEERMLYEADEALRLLERMARMKIQPSDYPGMTEKVFTGLPEISAFINELIFKTDGDLRDVIKYTKGTEDFFYNVRAFYLLTFSRDQKFIQNIMDHQQNRRSSNVALLAGGFHTPNLTEILKAQDISYSLVVPFIREETDHARYESLLLNQSITSSDAGGYAENISLRPARHRESNLAFDLSENRLVASRLAVLPGAFFMDTRNDPWIAERLIPELIRLQDLSQDESSEVTLEQAFGADSDFSQIIKELRPDFNGFQIRGKMSEKLTADRFLKLIEQLPSSFDSLKIPYLIAQVSGEFKYFHVIGRTNIPNNQLGGSTNIVYVSETSEELTGVKSPFFEIKDIHEYVTHLQNLKRSAPENESWFRKISLYLPALTLPVLITVNLAVAYIMPAAVPVSIAASIVTTIALSFIKNAYISKTERSFLRYGSSLALLLFLFLLMYAQQPMQNSGSELQAEIVSIGTELDEGSDDEGIELSMSSSGAPESSSVKSSEVAEAPAESATTEEVVQAPVLDPSDLFYEAPTQTTSSASSQSSNQPAANAGDGLGDNLFGVNGSDSGKVGANGNGAKGEGSGKVNPLALGQISDISIDITFDGSGSVGPEERALFKAIAERYVSTFYSVSTQNPVQFGLNSFDDEFRTYLPVNAPKGAETVTQANRDFSKMFDDFGGGTEVEGTVRALMNNHKYRSNTKFGKISFVIWDNGGFLDSNLLKKAHNEGIDIVFIVVGGVKPLNMPPKSIFLKNPNAEDVMFVIRQVLALKKKQGGRTLPYSNQLLLDQVGLPSSIKTSMNLMSPKYDAISMETAGKLGINLNRLNELVDRNIVLAHSSTTADSDLYPFFLSVQTDGRPLTLVQNEFITLDNGRRVLGSRLAENTIVITESPKSKYQSLEIERRDRIRSNQALIRNYVNQEVLSAESTSAALSDFIGRSGDVAITAHLDDFLYISSDELILRILETFALRHQKLKADGHLGEAGRTLVAFISDATESTSNRKARLIKMLQARLLQKSIDAQVLNNVSDIGASFAITRLVPVDQPDLQFTKSNRSSVHLPFSLQSDFSSIEMPMIGAMFAIGVAISRSAPIRQGVPVLDDSFFESGPDESILEVYNSLAVGSLQSRSELGSVISGNSPRMLWSYRIKSFAMEAIGSAMKAFMMTSRLTGISA